jgi:hypothetical protein
VTARTSDRGKSPLNTGYVVGPGQLVCDASDFHPDVGRIDWRTLSRNEFAGDRNDFVVSYPPPQQGQQRCVPDAGRARGVTGAEKRDDRRQPTRQSHRTPRYSALFGRA